MRIELTTQSWKDRVLPLNYIHIRWCRLDSNQQRSSTFRIYEPHYHYDTAPLARMRGFEPPTSRLTAERAAIAPHPQIMVGSKRIELLLLGCKPSVLPLN